MFRASCAPRPQEPPAQDTHGTVLASQLRSKKGSCVFRLKGKEKERKEKFTPKTRGRRGQEEVQCLFWVKGKDCERGSWRKMDYEGGNISATDTEHLQLLISTESLLQVSILPCPGILGAGMMSQASQPKLHSPGILILCSFPFPACPSFTAGRQPASLLVSFLT